jgi:hypothetical protein
MATLTSTKIKNTYDALLKASDNDAIGSSAKQITDGLGNGTPLYISTTQIGIGVTPEATYDLHVYSNAKVGGNLTITGDLTVNGTTTTVGTDTLSVKDPLIVLANNNTSADSVDIGFYGKYAPSGTTLYAGLFRDTGDGKFKIFRDLEEEPTTTVNTSGTGYTKADLVIGDLDAQNADITSILTTSQFTASSHIILTAAGSDSVINGIRQQNSNRYFNFQLGSSGGLKSFVYDGVNPSINWLSVDTSGNATFSDNIIVTGTGSFTGQVTIPATPSASTDAASKGYVDSQVGANNELSEVLANGNTTGGTDIAITAGDKITNFTSTGIDDNATSTALTIDSSEDSVFTGSVGAASFGLGEGTSSKISWLGSYGNWRINISDSANQLVIHSESDVQDHFTVKGGGTIQLNRYGSGNKTGTAAYNLSVDSSGNIIETDGDVVDGSGTPNDVAMWSDINTLTDAPIAISGNDATFAGDITVTGGDLTLGTDSIASNINAVGDVLAINVDSNTGGGAGANIQLKTAGTSQLTINSSSATFAGSVGIGTTSILSGNKLDVRGGNIMVGGFGGGTDYGLILTPDDGSGYWNIANVTGGALTFNNSATIGSSEQMRLTTTGLGIGTTPSTKLHILGGDSAIRITPTGSNDPRIDFTDNGGTVRFYTGYDVSSGNFVVTSDESGFGSSNIMVMSDAGNVGIGGVTSPSNKLHIYNTASADVALLESTQVFSTLAFKSSTNSSTVTVGIDGAGNAAMENKLSSGGLNLVTNGSTRLTINSSGNVGIGTTLPTAKLHLAVSSANDDTFHIFNGSVRTHLLASESTNGVIYMRSSSNTNTVKINSSGLSYFNGGNVGIGTTSPLEKLNIVETTTTAGTFFPVAISGARYQADYGVGIAFRPENNSSAYANKTAIVGSGGGYGYNMADLHFCLNQSTTITDEVSLSDTRMIIKKSGNVGIGTSSPTYKLQVNGTAYINETLYVNGATTVDDNFYVTNGNVGIGNTSPNAPLSFATSIATRKIVLYESANNNFQFYGFGIEAGTLLYSTGSNSDDHVFFSGQSTTTRREIARFSGNGDILFGTSTKANDFTYLELATNNRRILNIGSSVVSQQTLVNFRNPNGVVGQLQTDGSTTSFVTSSDYRLKENVVEMTDALDRVSQLKPSRFNFIANPDKTYDGFLAHEVQDIVPEAISGTKDAVDEKGNPIYQGIDQSKLVPLLVGAIQELKAEIETLKSQINN